MYPVTLIRVSRNKKITIELKNNEIFDGTMVDCDMLMNIYLKDVNFRTEKGNFFVKEVLLKGSFIKSIKLDVSVLEVQRKLEMFKLRSLKKKSD